MTNRCRYILSAAIICMMIGLLMRLMHFSILSLIFIFWIGLEWFFFRLKTLSSRKLFERLERTVDGQIQTAITLTLNRKFEVVLSVKLNRHLANLRLFIVDPVPQGLNSDDRWPAIIDSCGGESHVWKSNITPGITGRAALPGIQVTVTDRFGFFRHQRFIPLRQELTLMPFILQPKSTAEIVKSDNIQLLAGHHRYRKPGVSSELLGIREYQPGDPPRSIAWKATARTGKLMTCEYESEVPVRATIIGDVSLYQFWGRPGPAPFDALASTISSIARLLSEDKDPVGAVFCAGENQSRIRPGLGQRQLVRILQTLLNSNPGSKLAYEFDIADLETMVWKAVYRLYPMLLSDKINRPRLPLLLFGPKRRFQVLIRKQVSFALAWIQGNSMQEGYRLAYDNDRFRKACNTFFGEHSSVAQSVGLVANFGSGRLEKEQTVATICRSLMESVARARDNELFIIVGDFSVGEQASQQLVNAVRVARARFHRVMMVHIPPQDQCRFLVDPVARQAFEYLQSVDGQANPAQYTELRRLGATISSLDDINLLEQVIGELRILKSGATMGSIAGGRTR